MRASVLIYLTGAAMLATPAMSATTIDWSTITSATNNADGTTTALGTLDVNGTTVNVSYTASTAFVQTATSGSYFWGEGTPAPYTGGQYNAGGGYVAGKALADAPSDNSLVALSAATPVTVTFSQAVSNVYMALVSWNGDGIADFSAPFSLVSSGVGNYGGGSFSNVSSTGFTGNGELHGVIEFTGPITTLTFNATGNEYWHGFLLGTEGLAPPPTSGVPEPASWAMFISGFGLIGGMARRRKIAVSFA